MSVTTLTSREFNQDTARAKKEAAKGPVFITDRGAPSHVLLSISEYRRLTRSTKGNLIDMIAMPGGEDIEFDPPKLQLTLKPADFS